MDINEISKPWYDHWKNGEASAASQEAARRYYSVKNLLLDKVRNNMYHLSEIIQDDRFYDNLYQDKGPNDDNKECKDPNCKKPNFLNNFWFLHSSKPLQESIEKYASFPISSSFENKQPRLLIFSVDVAEGVTVTFDSYPKADDTRKSEYGKYINDQEKYEIVIHYNNGITIEHVMASGTIPEFYKYAKVPIHPVDQQKIQGSTNASEKINGNNELVRYFTDGGLLSNTPFRELLSAHQTYWKNVKQIDEIPDLDVYIVNVHASKVDTDKIRMDHDGVNERKNDIIYCDRTSYYDEKIAHLIADYNNFSNQLKGLIDYAISQINDGKKKQELDDKLKAILSTKTHSETGIGHPTKYEDLSRGSFNLNVAMRIERGSYINDVSGKTGDLTFETINKLIIEGKCDAWFSVIEKSINDIKKLDDKEKYALINALNMAWQNLRKNDYEDDDSQTYHLLTEFIKKVQYEGKLETYQSVKLIKSAEALLTILD